MRGRGESASERARERNTGTLRVIERDSNRLIERDEQSQQSSNGQRDGERPRKIEPASEGVYLGGRVCNAERRRERQRERERNTARELGSLQVSETEEKNTPAGRGRDTQSQSIVQGERKESTVHLGRCVYVSCTGRENQESQWWEVTQIA